MMPTFPRTVAISWLTLGLIWVAATVRADDWPTFRHDNRRSGLTAESLDVPALTLQWVARGDHPVEPAWPGPAKWDAYAYIRDLPSLRNYDPAAHLIVVGDRLYFGSSTDDAVHCLDARTGRELWRTTVGGPVRIPPTHRDGTLYFGSDDGKAYAVDAQDGRILWSYQPEPTRGQTLVINNGRPISSWPCRTGVLADGDQLYFAASMFPWKPSYLVAIDRTTREPEQGGFLRAYPEQSLTFEGAMLASSSRLIAPQGRVAPSIISRTDGAIQGGLDGTGGGSFALVTPDDEIVHGPGNKQGRLVVSESADRSKLATFPSGRAMVVQGTVTYVMTADSITALDRQAKTLLWKREGLTAYEIIVAGSTLFAGGKDRVLALDSRDGRTTWSAEVRGRAHALAVAQGTLFVSTDEAVIHAFRAGEPKAELPSLTPLSGRPIASEVSEWEPVTDPSRSSAIATVDAPGLVSRWVFQGVGVDNQRGESLRGARVRDLVGDRHATVIGDAQLVPVGSVEAVSLDGASQSALVAVDHAEADLPGRALTVEAWVRVTRTEPWGGILGAVVDNGGDESGWILGYNDDRFSFGLAGADGGKGITYLKASKPFLTDRWYHVAGTYDGQTLKIYVDGELSAISRDESGDILYPTRAFVEIGAYHDTDEYDRFAGLIHEVRLYDQALLADRIARQARARRDAFPGRLALAAGPTWTFRDPETAVVTYQTVEPVPTRLDYGQDALTHRIEDPTLRTEHVVTLEGLRPERIYPFVIRAEVDGHQRVSRRFEIETAFNYTPRPLPDRPSPYPDDVRAEAIARLAEQIVEASPSTRGICLVLGSDDGRLCYEVARRSALKVIGVETAPDRVALSRERLQEAGAYGTRVSILHVEDLNNLPLSGHLADLVVDPSALLDGSPRVELTELYRVTAPSGGVALIAPAATDRDDVLARLGSVPDDPSFGALLAADSHSPMPWRVRRGRLPASGEWSHQYGGSTNAAFNGESLMGATKAEDFEVQWIGRPGPRYHPERSGRKPSPLATNGRLFAQGLGRIIALNAYNGAILWSRELPEMLRFNLPRDTSNWCADDDHIYAAVADACWRIEAGTGRVAAILPTVPGPRGDWDYDWGYLAQDGDLVVGSAVKRDTAYTNFWGGPGWYDTTSGPLTDKVCSDVLFAYDKAEISASDDAAPKPRWVYRDGLVVNPTITIGGGRIYFVITRDPEVITSESRRQGTDLDGFWTDQALVALDLVTGDLVWERPLDDLKRGVVMTHVAYGSERIVLVASAEGSYQTLTISAADGSDQWTAEHDWLSTHHGGHMARPAIVADRLFVRPAAFNLYTGERLEAQMPAGGCGTYAASASAFFYRSGNVTLWNPENGSTSSFNRLRPGCWLSTIPANGMLLSPEGGGGCSCGSWMETSVGFKPRQQQ